MRTTALKLVTIIAEHILEDQLLSELMHLGARGYTIAEVRGAGAHGTSFSDWQGGNVRIETLVTPELAERIVEHVATHYFANYALVAYVMDAQVVRREKFT